MQPGDVGVTNGGVWSAVPWRRVKSEAWKDESAECVREGVIDGREREGQNRQDALLCRTAGATHHCAPSQQCHAQPRAVSFGWANNDARVKWSGAADHISPALSGHRVGRQQEFGLRDQRRLAFRIRELHCESATGVDHHGRGVASVGKEIDVLPRMSGRPLVLRWSSHRRRRCRRARRAVTAPPSCRALLFWALWSAREEKSDDPWRGSGESSCSSACAESLSSDSESLHGHSHDWRARARGAGRRFVAVWWNSCHRLIDLLSAQEKFPMMGFCRNRDKALEPCARSR